MAWVYELFSGLGEIGLVSSYGGDRFEIFFLPSSRDTESV